MSEQYYVRETGWCICDASPMGHGGMEGYDEGMLYRYQLRSRVLPPDRAYYRVYHPQVPGEEPYYETCGIGLFNQFFRKLTAQEFKSYNAIEISG